MINFGKAKDDDGGEEGEGKPLVDPSRVLGYIYADELYNEAEKFGLKSGIDTKAVREELAVSHGFCSPESTLLMLYTIEQLLENGISPPSGIPSTTTRRSSTRPTKSLRLMPLVKTREVRNRAR